jgi:hypothetical protein
MTGAPQHRTLAILAGIEEALGASYFLAIGEEVRLKAVAPFSALRSTRTRSTRMTLSDF